MREALRKSRALRKLVRWYRSRTVADPGWGKLLRAERGEWLDAVQRARGGPRVLLATSIGGYWAGTTLESLLAVALTLRGAEVEVLLCDGVLPACQACESRAFASLDRFARRGPQASLCAGCFEPGRKVFEGLGLRVHALSSHLEAREIDAAERSASSIPLESAAGHELDGLPIGEHALAGALRFFARGSLAGERLAEPILRRYLKAALLTAHAVRRLVRTNAFRCAAFHHGIYVPQGIIGAVLRDEGVRVVNWNPAYRKQCFVFSHGDTYHHTLLDEPASEWEDIPWTATRETELLEYLRSRRRGTEDWIWFHRTPEEDFGAIARRIGLDASKPFAGLLTNVIWDAQLHYPRRAFGDMMEWVSGTVRRLAARPDLQLVIRIHPAELRGTIPSREKVADVLKSSFPRLPANVIVVPPEDGASTYALMERADAALIYGTKTGVELAALGIPVVVAGEAWVRGKGFTRDAGSAEEYYRILDELPFRARLPQAEVERARRYAYHFFFRRMVPLECMEPTGADPPYRIRIAGLDDLRPGASRGLDVIADGILNGSPFVFRAEELEGAGRAACSG